MCGIYEISDDTGLRTIVMNGDNGIYGHDPSWISIQICMDSMIDGLQLMKEIRCINL